MTGPHSATETRAAARAMLAALDVHGAGKVGGEFLRLVARDPQLGVAAVHRSRGVERFAVAAGRRIVVDATPPRIVGREASAWVAFLESALRAGVSVATANKAPLALAWQRLEEAARAGGAALAVTATVGGGTPLLPALRGIGGRQPVVGLEATLSGTLGVVVPLVHGGASLRDAVAAASRLGYCEPDPALDLDGTDAWAKACILHNALWPAERRFGLADRPGPLRLSEAAIRALQRPAVVARLRPGRVELGLADWDPSPPNAGSGILVKATMASGAVLLSGAGAGPEATAAALLADVRALAHGLLPPGIH